MISYNGPEGTLMGRVFGIADDPTYAFYIALESYATGRLNEAFWTTAGDLNSFITVANFGRQPDQINVEFTYNGGSVTLPKIPLRTLESVTVDVRKAIAGKVPPTVTYGGIRISGGSVLASKIAAKEHIIGERERISTPFYSAPPYVTAFSITDFYTGNPETSINMDFGTTSQVYGTVFWSDGELGVDYDTPSSSNTSVLSVANGSQVWSWNLNTQGVGNSTVNWVSQLYPYDIYGDQTAFLAQLQVVVRPTISWNGGQIISNTTQNVVIGQQIFLTGNPQNGSWQISGVNVGGFQTGATGGSLLVNTNGTNVLFYWVTPGMQTATYTLNGIASAATFNVAGPANTNTTVTALQNANITPDQARLQLGFPPPGIAFHSTATPPPGYNGSMEYVQILNSRTVVFGYPDGTHATCTGSGLDTEYPYPFSNPPANTDTNDTPSLNLVSAVYSSESISDSFTMYLMWQPSLPNAIYVPLGYVSWSWGGLATFDSGSGNWILSNPNSNSNAYQPTTIYPQWAQVYTGDFQCGPRQ